MPLSVDLNYMWWNGWQLRLWGGGGVIGLRPAGEPRRQGEGRGVQHPFLAGPQRSGEDGVQGGDLQQYDHRLREARHQGLHLDPPQVQGRVGRQLQIIVNSLNLSLVEQSQITNKRKKEKFSFYFGFLNVVFLHNSIISMLGSFTNILPALKSNL